MRDYAEKTFVPQSLNCRFRLLKVEQKSLGRERHTPDYEEIETDCYGVFQPMTRTMVEDPLGRLVDVSRRLSAQFNEIAEHPAVNDRILILEPADSSGALFTIRTCQRYGQHFWEMMLERYKD